MPSNPILRITDGTTTISLLKPGAFWCTDWTPMRPELKGGGVWRGSPLSDGHQLVAAQYHNVIDTFELVCKHSSQDALIRERQELDRLLVKAREYWTTDWQTEPVWIEAKAAEETNIRYAVIHSYSMPMDDMPYGQSFFPDDGQCPTQTELTLSLEHGFWQAEEPGSVTCVEIAGHDDMEAGSGIYESSQSADDAFAFTPPNTISLATANMLPGRNAGGQFSDGGMRFRSVDIPQGATITSAFLRFACSGSQAGAPCVLQIVGEDNATPALFTTYANFMGRARTSAVVPWTPGAQTVGLSYDTPDISWVVKEIVNLGGWAAGNDMALFVEDNGSAVGAVRNLHMWDNGAGWNEPELHVSWYGRGQGPTCERNVYVANKRNEAQISHIFNRRAAAWSGNLVGAVLPFDIFPGGAGGPINLDQIYFGIETVPADTGPFCSLVFDISIPATYGAGDGVLWSYWNGGWAALTVKDNTANPTAAAATTTPFEESDVNSIHWEQPSDWATTVVNGVTGYWIQGIVSVATGVTRAQQDNRDIYTITWSGLDISDTTAAGAEQLGGDIPLLAKIIHIHSNSFIWALRSKSRGTSFQPFLNFADEQNPANVTVAAGASSAFATDTTSPSGRIVQYSPAGIEAITRRASITLGATIQTHYAGTFHAFVRYRVSAGADGDMRARFALDSYSSSILYSAEFDLLNRGEWIVQELGSFSLPGGTIPDTGYTAGAAIILGIDIENTVAAARVCDLMDLVLMPSDEWLGQFSDENEAVGLPDFWYLDIDSATRARVSPSSWVYETSTPPAIERLYTKYAAGPAILQANPGANGLYLWCFQLGNDATLTFDEKMSPPYYALRCELDAAHRYLSMRGDR